MSEPVLFALKKAVQTVIANHLMDDFEWPRRMAESQSEDIAENAVRAILTAMREPSEGMSKAAWEDQRRGWRTAEDQWRAMIDHLLGEP